MKPIRRSPTRLSSWAAVSAAVVALTSSGFYSWPALVVGTLGVLVLVGGLGRGSTATVTLGAFGLFVGALLAAVRGAPAVPVLVSVTATVLAWDSAGRAISIGTQLGREANTARLEAVHLAGSLVVGAGTVSVGYGIYWAGTGGQPASVVLFMLIGALLLLAGLD